MNNFIFEFEKEKVIDNSKIITSLRKNAQLLINQAEKINTEVSGNWTYRRQSFADSASHKKNRILKKAQAINNLADLWEINQCPDILKQVRSANDFDAYYPRPVEDGDGWYAESYPKLKAKADKMGLLSKEHDIQFKKAIEELSTIILTPEQIKERELKEALKKVHSYSIPGFFPTPDEVIDKMIDYAQLEDGCTLLEPSAGIGSILDRIKENGYFTNCCAVERQHSLCEILELKGYHTTCADILDNELSKNGQFERIVMNPPFENGQDVDHVRYCYNNFLKLNGKLVSVMSAGVKSNTKQKYVDFREWVNEKGGEIIDLGQAFKNAFNSTGVSTILLVIDK